MLGVRRKGYSIRRPDDRAGRKSGSIGSKIGRMAWSVLLVLGLIICAGADQGIDQERLDKWDCPTCKGETNYNLDIFNFLGHNPTVIENEGEKPPGPQEARAAMEGEAAGSAGGFVRGEFLATAGDADGYDVILDVGTEYSVSHIKGAVPLYWEELLDDENNPRSPAEIAEVLGNAGISPEDSVLIYGDCATCDGISVAPFVFWAMRYVGHDDVAVLDGGLDGWVAAGHPTERNANERPAVTYTPRVRSDLLADYDGVARGVSQIVDARTFQEFGADKIPGAVNIDYSAVLANGRMKAGDELAAVFADLDKAEPVVVYSNAGARASMVWYALQLMGYESSLYSWNDWDAKRPPVKAVLKEARAEPNPARPGPVKIFAAFEVVPDEADSDAGLFVTITASEEAEEVEEAASDDPVEGAAQDLPEIEGLPDETNGSVVGIDEIEDLIQEASSLERPTVQTTGCVACFDPVALYASGSNPSSITGGVKLGSVGKTNTGAITAAGALIQNQDGDVMATIELAATLGDEHLGTWDASGAPDGLYIVTVAATAGGKTSYFEDVLTIEIDSSAPVQETATSAASTGIKKLGRY
ncbi:rhodanese-like domain-containing protein [Methanotrichaceae archaeon M04Ac]|uniref:Rhodanese-like domain-containing protein n=1 Tax=Candidatus Methanocrinis alkalitolerans TaxID=3033395 RepID=A0ABT5XBY7_9EURY|nr:rhodanese-like domain-containing protein [Candidatus Methanocrinis alkalitolerans]MDF0592224.1 rhodanese-like domain-containing protein [Candidatus Methanocrinis alkalitolerans]